MEYRWALTTPRGETIALVFHAPENTAPDVLHAKAFSAVVALCQVAK